MIVVVWAWESLGQQRIEVLQFSSQELAVAVAQALQKLSTHQIYSAVRVFETPHLVEIDLG